MKCVHFTLMLMLLTMLSCRSGNGQSQVNRVAESCPIPQVVFNSDSAYAYVQQQVDFGPRIPGSAGHAACADFIIDRLKRYGADTVTTQNFTSTTYLSTEIPLKNIMGRYNTQARDRVLLLAHYDTRPWADADPNVNRRQEPVPGANDGGSGVGVLLEIARQLCDTLPDVGVDLLFVDGEDSGLSDAWGQSEETWCLGTQYWVKNMPYAADDKPRYAILLDMVGGKDARFYREYFSQTHAESINDKVWSNAAAAGYGNRFPNEIRGGITDDHVFVNRAGIPCIDIIECGNAETGSFPVPWHTVSDDMSHIDRMSLKAVGQTVVNTIFNEKTTR